MTTSKSLPARPSLESLRKRQRSERREDLGGFVVLERGKLQILSEDEDPKP
jgi:hypothetical protein